MTIRHSVLVIEDDEVDYEMISRKFSKVPGHAFDMHHCADLAAAIEVIGKKTIDLVLLDNHLGPEIDIRASLPKLRQAGYTNPIGILSSDVENATVDQFDDLGGDFRLSKDELDPSSIRFMLSELSRNAKGWDEDW